MLMVMIRTLDFILLSVVGLRRILSKSDGILCVLEKFLSSLSPSLLGLLNHLSFIRDCCSHIQLRWPSTVWAEVVVVENTGLVWEPSWDRGHRTWCLTGMTLIESQEAEFLPWEPAIAYHLGACSGKNRFCLGFAASEVFADFPG